MLRTLVHIHSISLVYRWRDVLLLVQTQLMLICVCMTWGKSDMLKAPSLDLPRIPHSTPAPEVYRPHRSQDELDH